MVCLIRRTVRRIYFLLFCLICNFLDGASLLRRMSVKRQVNYPGDVKEAVRFFKGVHIRTAAPKRIL